MSQMVESVARQMYERDFWGERAPKWEAMTAIMRQPFMLRATEAIESHTAALAEAGMVIVPREPTEAMVKAGMPYQSEAALRCAWRAMLDAALRNEKSAPTG